MRKQTKLVAVASAAALLAIGGAMTSFAAQGWVEEDGTWYFYDKDGNRVTDEWRKSGDNWFWLDGEDNGAMATDKLVEDDDDTYYVDGNGAMVKNTWVKVVNEDQDDDDPAEYHYYYMQNSGKAYKASDNSSNTKFRTIDGKKYAFDNDGIMLYGWVTSDGELATGDDGWESAKYYCGSWEDGAMKTGWQKVTVYDDKDGKDDDYDYWFNFKSNGEKRGLGSGKENWKSNGKYYSFDNRGVMIYQWAQTFDSIASGSTASVSNWRYYNSPEDGARQTKGWFKVVAPGDDNDNTFREDLGENDTFAKTHANDESEKWYYAGDKGELYKGEIKSIKGKYYGFWPEDTKKGGSMLTGLCILNMNADGTIADVIDDDIDSDALDDILDGNYKNDNSAFDQSNWNNTSGLNVQLYYFGNDADTDGAMKTGNVTVKLDGESYSFYFQKTGTAKSGKGQGVTGIDDNKYVYLNGCKVKADSDDKYQLVRVTANASGSKNINASGVKVEKVDVDDAILNFTKTYENKDNENVNVAQLTDANLYLVNTSGNIQKNKTALKDGNDCYYYLDGYTPKVYTDNKTLKSANTDPKKGEVITDWKGLVKKDTTASK